MNAFVRRLFVTSEQSGCFCYLLGHMLMRLLPWPEVYLRHAPEGQFVFVTFAAAFLIKVMPFIYFLNI